MISFHTKDSFEVLHTEVTTGNGWLKERGAQELATIHLGLWSVDQAHLPSYWEYCNSSRQGYRMSWLNIHGGSLHRRKVYIWGLAPGVGWIDCSCRRQES